jgi:hypothetical protein
VESQLGAGAVFVLTFPKAKAPGTGASESFDAGEAFDPFDEGSQS